MQGLVTLITEILLELILSIQKHIFPLLLRTSIPFFLVSCGGGSVTTLPEAPPPYPNFPVPYEPSTPSTSILPTSPNPQVSSPYPSGSYQPVSSKSWESSPNALTSSNYARFTVHAKSNIWLLVQDPNGNELDWLKLQSGEKVPLTHMGALTLTCSSGQDVEIYDKNGKKLDMPRANKSGISIIRLN